MMNESTKQQSDTQSEAESGLLDPEIEQLLGDAYDVPVMPRSLLTRIDRAVTAEWGVSPKLVSSPVADRWKSLVTRGARFGRSLPVAGAVALVVVLSVVFSGDSRTFAWSTVLEALERHGVVQISEDGESRWLSLSDGVVSERSKVSIRLIDLREQVQLERGVGAETVERREIAGVDRTSLVLGFLLGNSRSRSGLASLENARVLSEQWEARDSANGGEIALRVTFKVADDEQFTIAMCLDPETSLPMTIDSGPAGGVVTSTRLIYSTTTTTTAELRQQEFPPGLAVVDVGSDGKPLVAGLDLETVRSSDKGVSADRSAGTEVALNDGVVPKLTDDAAADSHTTLFNAPSKWSAVAPVSLGTAELAAKADTVLAKLWDDNSVVPAEEADEAELLRRVYLDLVGRTPSVTEVRHWLSDRSPDRYEVLVDRLLNSADHASHIATVWRSFLIPEGVDLVAFGGVKEFDQWLAERFASDDSYDEVVRSLLLAEGRLSRSGPLLFYSALKLDPDQLAARTSRVFLGMRLECAQCHDHPFEPWSQQEFWGFAAFFAQISRPQGVLATASTVMRVRDVDRGEVMLPGSEVVVLPGFLDGSRFSTDANARARRQQLADWLTGARNPYFARATVNRVWGHMFGKGIVDPIDDFGTIHKPTSPELLDLLAGHFLATNFSLREVFRAVALTRSYRLSSGAATVDENRPKLFAQMNVKTLTAEQVFDCIAVAALLENPVATPDGVNVERFANTPRDEFVTQFRTPVGRTTEYLGGIPQALTLMNGTLISGATGLTSSGLLTSLEAPFFTNQERIEVLYLATLSRKPAPEEWELLNEYIRQGASGSELREGLSDILWALLNSAEFTLNH